MKGWPHSTHPTGWYIASWSWDLTPSQVKPMQLFGEEVVLYRTEAGEANILDAFCPHLGANLGKGGCVVGDMLQCPWHGWRWNLDGSNAEIPFTDKRSVTARVRQWHVRERDHLIIVWFDALGREPTWEWGGVPEFSDPEGFYQPQEHPSGAVDFGVLKVKPQLIVENAADVWHFPFVHGGTEPATHEAFEPNGHLLRTELRILFGAGHERTWLTPNGPEYATIESENWGLGFGVVRFNLQGLRTTQVVGLTPIDDDYCMTTSTIASTREPEHREIPGGRSAKMIENQAAQVRNDFHIWENQAYVQHPPFLMPYERHYAQLRKWFEQFYPIGSEESTKNGRIDSAAREHAMASSPVGSRVTEV